MQMIDEHHWIIDHTASSGDGDVPWLVIDVHHLETGMAYALRQRCQNISFSNGMDAKTKGRLDLSVLKALPFLEGLDLACDIKKPIDLSSLYALENLKDLWLRTTLPECDFQHFPHLQCLLVGNLKFRGGRFLRNLRRVRVAGYTNEMASELAAIPNLEEIEFRACNAEYLENFDRYPSIRRLTLRAPGKLVRLDEVAANPMLVDFDLEGPSRLKDLSVLGKSKSIECIWILQKEIASCGFVREMKSLRDFSCNASILDNDIQPVLDSKSLTYVRLSPMKKSYVPKMTSAELDELFARRQS